MAVRDLLQYVRERIRVFDGTIDLTPGAPFDTQFIQPLLRRLGTDPFSVDLPVFLRTRLAQAFPELAQKEGDAVTDLLIKPATLLWDPILREIFRVRTQLSLRDPTRQTTDEAEALGANFFSQRERGGLARGTARIYYAQPQNSSISPQNFFTSRDGLVFFPTEIQSIRLEEMLFNLEGNLYYFDVTVQAENPGTEYNIPADSLVTIANIESAVRVTNKRRFRSGVAEEDAVTFIDRVQQELTERSLVTQRGIGARVLNAFPAVTRLGVVGFNDPEMQRDVLKGGGLGPVVAGGLAATVVFDGSGLVASRRLQIDASEPVDFLTLIGPATVAPENVVITLHNAFNGVPPAVRDLEVVRVVDATTLEVAEPVLGPPTVPATLRPWTLRRRSLTLSDIPGGIVFPDGSNGTVEVVDDEVHIGGSYDIHLRGADFDEETLLIDAVTDDEPLARGIDLEVVNTAGLVRLNDLVLGTDYFEDDITFVALENAAREGFTLTIVEGVDAGNYTVLSVTQVPFTSPELVLDPAPTNTVAGLLWRLLDQLNVDLAEPKETRIVGNDLETVQNLAIVTTTSGVDFDEIGVSQNDVLRILNGPDAGDFVVQQVLAPFFNQVQLDRALTQTTTNLRYTIFRENADGGLQVPFVRLSKVELLDSNSQPVGTTIPYAKPIDVQSRAFQNPGRGVKYDYNDGELGILSQSVPGGGFAIGLQSLDFRRADTNAIFATVVFTAGNKTVTQVINEINTTVGYQLAVPVGTTRVGIRPVLGGTLINSGTALAGLFGNAAVRSSYDIRIPSLSVNFNTLLNPVVDLNSRLDVFQVLDGVQIGPYDGPYASPDVGTVSVSATNHGVFFDGFAPEAGRRVQVGARSIGSARVYFLEPTSIEFDSASRFSVELESQTLEFLPDPTLDTQKIPAPPSDPVPDDGDSLHDGVSTLTLTSLSQDFIRSGIRVGDRLAIEFVPITGSLSLGNPVIGLALTTLIVSINGGPDRTITFIQDDPALNPGEVTRTSVVQQINALAGQSLCYLNGSQQVVFQSDVSLVIRGSGTANALLGLPLTDTNNFSPHNGSYTITGVTQTTLTVSDPTVPLTLSVTDQTFRVFRTATQRIGTTDMAENQAEAGLYYFDVELVSLGAGDQYNIEADLQLVPTNFRSDGYFLTTDDENLTFSPAERPKMVLSRTIFEAGVSDDPQNATQLSGQNLQITYERSSLVEDINNFALEETERVVCSSPLARHLIPHFVRLDVTYVGGSIESEIVPEIEDYINGLFPIDELESSDVQQILLNAGATSISNPLDLIALVHNLDRSIFAQRSQDALGTETRLSAFIPDRISLTRNIG